MPSSNAANTPEIPTVPWQLLLDACNHTASISEMAANAEVAEMAITHLQAAIALVLLLYWLVLLSTLLKLKVHLSAQLTKQCVGIAEMGAKAEVAEMAMTYLRCRAIAAPISLAMFVATGSFRGFKDTRSAFQHMLTGSAGRCSQGLQPYAHMVCSIFTGSVSI